MVTSLSELRKHYEQQGNTAAPKSEGGHPNYVKYKECQPDQVLVDGLIFAGVTENQFGKLNFNFDTTDAAERTVLPQNGLLMWLRDNGKLVEGKPYLIGYICAEPITTGPFKGKSQHKLEVVELKNPSKPTHSSDGAGKLLKTLDELDDIIPF